MERSQTTRGRGRPRKIIKEVIKKDLEFTNLDKIMVLNRTLEKVGPCRLHLVRQGLVVVLMYIFLIVFLGKIISKILFTRILYLYLYILEKFHRSSPPTLLMGDFQV